MSSAAKPTINTAAKKPAGTRNPKRHHQTYLAKGVPRFGRNALGKKKGLWAIKNLKNKKIAKTAAVPTTRTITTKKGVKRTITRPRVARAYGAELRKVYSTHKAQKVSLRKSITPGTVLIILAGRNRGRRVVFLKQLPSGLLLVTGPYLVNGIPLKRVNQAYVIATSTKIALPKGYKVPEKISDEYFKARKAAAKSGKTEEKFFSHKASTKERKEHKKKAAPERIADQKSVDTQLIAVIKKTPQLRNYLSTGFSLSKNQFPHLLKF
jgi:large subunit ribosomal protein L6e